PKRSLSRLQKSVSPKLIMDYNLDHHGSGPAPDAFVFLSPSDSIFYLSFFTVPGVGSILPLWYF
ncbi:MAG: hypothetical protein ACFFCS_10515, partial [Candidatus Hodarchaeota archaeon]